MSAPASPSTERTQAILLRQRATSAASDVQGFGSLILAGRAALQYDGSIVGAGSIMCSGLITAACVRGRRDRAVGAGRIDASL
jgi:hypothetical protein